MVGGRLPAASRSTFAGSIRARRDALVQKCDLQLGIAGSRLLKHLESLLEKLLVHVGHAQVVQACRIGGGVRLEWESSRENGRRGQGNKGAEQEARLGMPEISKPQMEQEKSSPLGIRRGRCPHLQPSEARPS